MTTTCPTSYYQDVAFCSDEIILDLNATPEFTPGDDVMIRFEYPNGLVKLKTYESSSYDGLIIIPNNDLWDASTGVLLVTILALNPTFCETEYLDIVLTITNIETDDLTTYIPTC